MKTVNKQNYNETVKINNRVIGCYDKKMLRELYPDGNYSIIGETFEKNNKKAIGTILLAKKNLKISKYGTNSKILYKRKGYLEVANKQFLVLLQSRLGFFALLLGLITVGGLAVFMGLKVFTHAPVIAPDYPLPPEDNNASDIPNDNSSSSDSTHKNRATIKVAREVKISLSDKKVEFIYQNFNASNKDAVVTLCVLKNEDEYAIARSGLIKSGKEIKTMTLLSDAIKLSEGIYKGRIKIDFYDENTGERAATSADFDDVEIVVKK